MEQWILPDLSDVPLSGCVSGKPSVLYGSQKVIIVFLFFYMASQRMIFTERFIFDLNEEPPKFLVSPLLKDCCSYLLICMFWCKLIVTSAL